ncbi:unnamed protein product, partial [Tilletia caries]
MAEHDVDENVQQMFKKAHHAVFNHNLAESQRAALQKYYAWNRSTWCRRYQLIVNSGSEDPIFDLAVVDSADLDVYVREEETRARQEQKAKLAAMQAKMDQLVAVATVRQPETYTPPARSSNPPPSSSRKPKTKRTGDRSSFRTEIAGVASTARPYACARCGGRALHDVGRCEKTHFAKPSCATYETITRRDKADGPLIFKDTGTVVCLNFNGGRACNYKGCPGHRCSLCGADAWASVPEGLGLGDRYADVVQGLREGFDLEIPRITSTAIASNAPSANIHRSALREIILKERQRGAYIGPFQNAGDVQDVLHNAFQSMPLSLIPKPPDKFRLIQNFSASVGGSKATNDLIPRSWATTWSTFRQIIGNILSLPADSEACTRDVDSA